MKQLKHYTITGTVFVIIAGIVSHFLYEWSNHNFIVGFFAPINESTWEHMKLIFFPMLLFSLVAAPKLKECYPCIISSLLTGNLIGTFLIPIFFYTYTGILGQNVFILDLAAFLLAVLIAFAIVYRFTLSCRMEKHKTLLYIVICALLICFPLFTCLPPAIGLFTDPLSK